MLDPNNCIAERLLLESAPRAEFCSNRGILRLLLLTNLLGCLALFFRLLPDFLHNDEQHFAVQESATTMELQYKPYSPPLLSPARFWHSVQLKRLWRAMLPARAKQFETPAVPAASEGGAVSIGIEADASDVAKARHHESSGGAVFDLRSSVVKMFNTRQAPNWGVPWQAKSVDSSTGSGAVIKLSNGSSHILGVLTAAHVIAESRYLQIQRSSDRFGGEKFPARVMAVCHELDLALVIVDDPGALAEIMPLEVAPADQLPRISDKVRVIGYPIGGNACSITEGTVSRVEVQDYSHSFRQSLALTVDAAINSGNSGGPIVDTEMSWIVGVAIQKLVATGIELQGHAVPAPLVRRFLTRASGALEKLHRDEWPYRVQMPSMGVVFQSLESSAMRRGLGLPPGKTGMYVSEVPCKTRSSLREGDVMLAFDGHTIDNVGFCEVLGQRLQVAAARDLREVGQQVRLTIWRDGHEVEIQDTLKASPELVARGQHDVTPSFFICGGLVFQPLTHGYMQTLNPAGAHLVNKLLWGRKNQDQDEVIVLSQVLEDRINYGYGSGNIGAPLIKSVNGQPIRNLSHLADLVQEARSSRKSPYLRFDAIPGPIQFVIPIDNLTEADQRIAKLYGAPAASLLDTSIT